MGTETRVGILAGLVIVVVASVYFFYGSDHKDDEILVASATRVSEQPKIPVDKDAAKPDPRTNGRSPSATQQRTPPRRLADRLAMRPPQNRPGVQPTQVPIILADPSKGPATTPPVVPLRTNPSSDLVEATWENLLKPGNDSGTSGKPTAPASEPTNHSGDRGVSGDATPATIHNGPSTTPPALANGGNRPGYNSMNGRPSQGLGRQLPGQAQGASPQQNPNTRTVFGVTPPHESASRPIEPRKHVIADGDTLVAIADKYYGDSRKVDIILAANPKVRNPRNLKIGTELIIPPAETSGVKASTGATDVSQIATKKPAEARTASARTYTVQSGDTLYSISQRVYGSGVRWEEILKNNKSLLRGDPKRLSPGMTLQLP